MKNTKCLNIFKSFFILIISSVQFSHSVVSDSLRPHEPQHARPPCLSPTPGVYSNSCPSSRWCHPAISFSVIPFSSCPQSFPAAGAFPMNNSSHEVAKVLEFQLQYQSFQWTPRIDLLSKASICWCSAFFTVQLSHLNMTTGKTIALTRWTFVGKVMIGLSICYLNPVIVIQGLISLLYLWSKSMLAVMDCIYWTTNP